MSQDTVPSALRVSDEEREKAIERLQHEFVTGRLSNDTFLARTEMALHARRAGELAALLHDLPGPAQRTRWRNRCLRWLGRGVGWCSTTGARIRQAWRTPRLPALVLPRGDRVFVIGRAPACDFPIPDMTVSWRHAELRQAGGEWLLADLSSTNGTRVNGWRAGTGFVIRPGDRVSFGSVSFLIAG